MRPISVSAKYWSCDGRGGYFPDMTVNDESWMALAFEEAERGVGRTAPNPPVGAVLVKNGEVIGKGWHRAAGQPHAEREALADAMANVGAEEIRGATIYVTLEPCSTHGRTPPCTAGLIDAGVAGVVYACTDRNPDHAGRADGIFQAAGISVTSGVCAARAGKLLRPFFKVKETGLPWVIWKTGMSLDGRITRPPGEGQWLTNEQSRRDVQLLRSKVDAILTSGETVRRDNPSLTIRVPEFLEGRNQPWRVIATNQAETLPAGANLLSDEWRDRTLVKGRGDLEGLLRGLVAEQGVLSVLVEAGGIFSAAMMEAELVDEVVSYVAPMLCGGPLAAMGGHGVEPSLQLGEVSFERFGDDVKASGIVLRGAGV